MTRDLVVGCGSHVHLRLCVELTRGYSGSGLVQGFGWPWYRQRRYGLLFRSARRWVSRPGCRRFRREFHEERAGRVSQGFPDHSTTIPSRSQQPRSSRDRILPCAPSISPNAHRRMNEMWAKVERRGLQQTINCALVALSFLCTIEGPSMIFGMDEGKLPSGRWDGSGLN